MRPSRRAFLVAAGIAAVAAVALSLYEVAPDIAPRLRLPLAAPEHAKEIVALVRPGPVVYFPGPDGRIEGLDADLLRLYAAERKLPLRFVAMSTTADVLAALGGGDAHLAAGGLLRADAGAGPASPGASAPPSGSVAAAPIDWTSGYYLVEPVLIYNTEGFKPASWDDLDGETVAYAAHPGDERENEALRAAHPAVLWQPVANPSPVELIAQVAEGTLSYAIVGSLAAAIARNIYLDFDVAFTAGTKRPLAWAVPGAYPGLREDLDRFLARVQRDGTLERLIERYVPDARAFLRLDASGLMDRMRSVLPQYAALFRDAQERTGIEWRLLAALAFQESKWDPAAQSETGVRGLMQLTEDTAKRMGVTNLLDPAQNVLAGARYLRRPQDAAARAHSGAGSDLARARGLQHRSRPSRGRAGTRAAAGPRSRPLDQRQEGAAAPRPARALRAREARLRAGRDARRVRRSGPGLLRRAARAPAVARAAAAAVRQRARRTGPRHGKRAALRRHRGAERRRRCIKMPPCSRASGPSSCCSR